MPAIRLLRDGEHIEEVADFRHLPPLDPEVGLLPHDFDFVPRHGEVVYPLSGMKVGGRPYQVLIHESCLSRVEALAPWCPNVQRDEEGRIVKVYAMRKRRKRDGPGPSDIYMHRFLTNVLLRRAVHVDHLNGCTLDNRILKPDRNLIPGSVSDNGGNVVRSRASGIEYVGVHCVPSQGSRPYRGEVTVDGKRHRTRWYPTARRAAIARDILVIRLYRGTFLDFYRSKLNFPDLVTQRLKLEAGEHVRDFEIPFDF